MTYFEESVNVLTLIENKKIVFDNPTKEIHHPDGTIITVPELKNRFNAHLAALFYVMQNASNYNDAVRVRTLKQSGNETLHLPISILTAEGHYAIKVFPCAINDKKLNFISYIHENKPTEFLQGDGWELFQRADITSNDLIILSGHFSDAYLSEDELFQKVNEYIMPATQKGAQVVVINSFSEGKKACLEHCGFQVSRHERGRKNKPYLLALKNIDTTMKVPASNKLMQVSGNFLLNLHTIERASGSIPGLTRARMSNEYYLLSDFHPDEARRDNVKDSLNVNCVQMKPAKRKIKESGAAFSWKKALLENWKTGLLEKELDKNSDNNSMGQSLPNTEMLSAHGLFKPPNHAVPPTWEKAVGARRLDSKNVCIGVMP